VLGNPQGRNAQLNKMKADFDNSKGVNDSVRSRGSRASNMSSIGSKLMKEHQRYKSGIVNDMALVPSPAMKR
jgi:hypothetical protein